MSFRPARLASILIFISFTLLFAFPAHAWDGVVLRVHDGDTAPAAPEGATHGDTLVRLYGIDAPELDQPGGKASRDTLQQLVQPGEPVKIVPRSDDRYGRVVGLLIRNERILVTAHRVYQKSIKTVMVSYGQFKFPSASSSA